MTGAPKVSAAVVRNQLRAARALSSDDAVNEALASLPQEIRDELVDTLPISWCALSSVRAFHEATARIVGTETNAWHLRVVEQSMQQTFSTVWRFFLRLTSPEALIKRSASVYAKTFDTGAMEAHVISPGHSMAQLTKWPDVPDFHLNAVATGIATMLRVAGRKTVHVRWERTAGGANFHIHSNRVEDGA